MTVEIGNLRDALIVRRDQYARRSWDENPGTEEWYLNCALVREINWIIDIIDEVGK